MFHAWFYLLSCVLSTLWSTFHMISWTNLLTRATVPAACFLLFLVPGKSENEYSRNWTGQKPKILFHQKTPGAIIWDGVGLGPNHTTWPRGLGLAAPGGGLAAPDTPSVSLFAYKMPSDLKTQGGDVFLDSTIRNQKLHSGTLPGRGIGGDHRHHHHHRFSIDHPCFPHLWVSNPLL